MSKFHEVFPCLMVRDAKAAIVFYSRLSARPNCSGSSSPRAASDRPSCSQFYGERSCRLGDPFGHAWLLVHSIEKVEPQEMQQRHTAMHLRWSTFFMRHALSH